MDDRGVRLANALVALVENAEAGCGEAGYALQFATSMAEFFAPTEVCLLLAAESGRPGSMTMAASTARARALLSAAAAVADGPFSPHAAAGGAMLNRRVTTLALRWPEFSAAASAAGYGVVSAVQMRCRDQVLGVICTLGPGSRQLTTAESRLLRVLARSASVAISQQRVLAQRTRTAEQLQQALDSRVVIEQAKGAIAARLGMTTDTAFALLRDYARRASRPLAEVAAQAVHGDLPVYELLAPRERAGQRPAG